MSYPVLLVETPRAGSAHHRFLVSTDSNLTSSNAADLAGMARAVSQSQPGASIEIATGGNFLAVHHAVVQSTTQRLGSEMLLLHGLDTEKLDDALRQHILSRLQARLIELEHVLAGRDWSEESSVVVEEPALNRWLQEDFPNLPLHSERERPLPLTKGYPLWFWLLVIPGWLLVAILLIAIFWSGGDPTAPQTGATQSQSDPQQQKWQQGLKQLQKQAALTEPQALKSLFALAADKPPHLKTMAPDEITPEHLYDIPAVRSLLTTLSDEQSQLDPFHFLTPKDQDEIQRLFPGCREEAQKVRRTLKAVVGEALLPFRRATAAQVKRGSSPGTYYAIAQEIQQPIYRSWENAQFHFGLPFLSREEVQMARQIYGFLRSAPVSKALRQNGIDPGTTSELRWILEQMRSREWSQQFIDQLNKERVRVIDQASEAEVVGLITIYREIRKWIEAISRSG